MSGSSHQVGRGGVALLSRLAPSSSSSLSLSVSERSDLFAHTHLRPRPPEAVDVPRSPRFARGRPRVHLSWRSLRARSALPTMTHQRPVDCAPPLRNLRRGHPRAPARTRPSPLSPVPAIFVFFFLRFFAPEISRHRMKEAQRQSNTPKQRG